MTTETTTHSVPSFRTHSRLGGLVRDLSVVAICAAIVGGFLAQVWRAPEPVPSGAAGAAEVVSLLATGR